MFLHQFSKLLFFHHRDVWSRWHSAPDWGTRKSERRRFVCSFGPKHSPRNVWRSTDRRYDWRLSLCCPHHQMSDVWMWGFYYVPAVHEFSSYVCSKRERMESRKGKRTPVNQKQSRASDVPLTERQTESPDPADIQPGWEDSFFHQTPWFLLFPMRSWELLLPLSLFYHLGKYTQLPVFEIPAVNR